MFNKLKVFHYTGMPSRIPRGPDGPHVYHVILWLWEGGGGGGGWTRCERKLGRQVGAYVPGKVASKARGFWLRRS